MFDIGAAELLVIVIIAVLVIGPKDMPLALRTAGQWIGKIRRVSAHFRTGLDAMVREAELEEMEKKWKAQNEAIMAKSSAETPADPKFSTAPAASEGEMTGPPIQTAEDRAAQAPPSTPEPAAPDDVPEGGADSQPQLPLNGAADAKKDQG